MDSFFSFPTGLAFVIMPLMFLIGLVIAIFFLLNLHKLLSAIAPQNRKMPANQVWLLLIPVFNIVWQFIVVDKVSKSIVAEYNMRSIAVEERPTYNIGITYCILSLCNWIPIIGFLASIAILVFGILYWVKTAEYRRSIESMEPYSDKDSLIFNAN